MAVAREAEAAPMSPDSRATGDMEDAEDNVPLKENGKYCRSIVSTEGEFDWDKSLRGTILSSFFYGYICTQILGGWLAGRYGGKHVLGTAMVIVLAMTVVTPIAARTHPYLVIAVRVLMGLADGVVFPSMHTLWGQWAPPLERSKLMTFCYSGIFVGIIVALSFSGVLCEIQLDGGWPFIFYVYGATCFLWLCCWHIFVFDSPARHPRISQSERRYIERAIGHPPGEKRVAVPWLQFARSPAVWAIVVAHTCNNWGHYTLMTSLPLFMKEVLAFEIKQNGVYSALPFAAMAGGVVLCGQLADQLRRRAVLNTTWTRKLFQAVGGFLPAAFMVATAFIDCDTRMAGVAFLTLAMTFSAGALAGYQINHADIAPRFAGEIFGITNTVATIPGMISPSVVSALTPNGSKEEWQRVLFISGAIYSFGALFFLIFASGEEQSWDKVDNMSYQEDQEAKERFQIDDLALSTL
ncbi:sialin-like [Lingula anatina]|uniref:Sialin-like n=1 Tax=Lingula anatina TaxID=7574 RepID=A0A1S3K1C4_LINAN|nr:sialin-like [Lingula anatina]|eukprot:XP_013416430.1 sialin-like [Lingula anatina]